MTEDSGLREADLHLPPETITEASKAVADLYRENLKVPRNLEFRENVGGSQESVKIRMEKERERAWKDVAGKFPHLSTQISGLRSALVKGRKTKDSASAVGKDKITNFLTQGVLFKDDMTKEFFQDILFRRIMMDDSPGLFYLDYTFLQREAEHMRQELDLGEGANDMTLEQAVRLVLTGGLSLTRQTDSPDMDIS